MNIGVDARSLIEKKVGFGYFLENMLGEILELDRENTYFLFSDREIVSDVLKYKNVKTIIYKYDFFFKKSFYYYYRLPKFIDSMNIQLDVFWGTIHLMPKGLRSSVKKVLTIHDFTHLKFPKSTTKYNLLISKLFIGPSIRNSDEIICISDNTKKEMLEFYPKECTGKLITTIYEGGNRIIENIDYDKISGRVKKISDEPFVLFVGTIEPRKNIRVLLDIAPKLKGKMKVVICGKIGWESKEVVEKLRTTDNLEYLDYISNDEKIYLMKKTFCQIQPSLYEGFGLPVVESMQEGTIVIVANNSSLAELIEIDKLKFETSNPDDLVNKIEALLYDETVYCLAKQYCNRRALDFDWKKAAKKYLEIFAC